MLRIYQCKGMPCRPANVPTAGVIHPRGPPRALRIGPGLSPTLLASAGDTEAQSPRPSLRVLVVDDEPDTVMTLLMLLSDAGYDAKGAGSGHAAVALLGEFDPDVIVSDINMPAMNGWELAKAVRRSMGEKRPTLIAISGRYPNAPHRTLIENAGFNHFIAKPADPKVLLALLEKAGKA
jgi:CheY-like chemotaxis protein